MRVDYVEFMFPGAIVSETSMEPWPAEKPVKPPERAFGYRRAWREEAQQNGETLRGPVHYGPTTYYGRVRTLDDIPDTERNRILRWNMRTNNYDRVVSTRFGQSFPMNADDRAEPDPRVA